MKNLKKWGDVSLFTKIMIGFVPGIIVSDAATAVVVAKLEGELKSR